MKLIMAIVNNDDSSTVQKEFTKAGLTATKLATTGGFLMAGNTTYLLGISDEEVDNVLELLAKYSRKRTEIVTNSPSYVADLYSSPPVEITIGGATVFVLNVERFEKI